MGVFDSVYDGWESDNGSSQWLEKVTNTIGWSCIGNYVSVLLPLLPATQKSDISEIHTVATSHKIETLF